MNPIKIDIQFAKRRFNFDINLTKSKSDSSRFWDDETGSALWDVNTFRNTTEQLKAYSGWVG
ncbi:hypothetical protein ES705_34964 [subsurface metagenome]